MTTLTVEVDTSTINFISSRHRDINSYLSKLIKEDMLLSEINESKKSGINKLNSINDLDN
jgi:hypothetical protein